MNAIEFPYRPVPNDENVQYSWQGLALLEWDPDFTGQGVGIGTAQWRLWYQNAYITGLVNDGLTHCLSTDRDGDDQVTAIAEATVSSTCMLSNSTSLLTPAEANLDIAGNSADTSCAARTSSVSKRDHNHTAWGALAEVDVVHLHEWDDLDKRSPTTKYL